MSYDEESIANAILTALGTNMATQIAAVVTDKGDAVTPPTPRLYYMAEQHEIPEMSASIPACCVLVEEARSIDDQFIGGTRDMEVDAVITLGYIHGTETTLQQYCYRSSRAASKIMWDKSLNGLGAVGAKTIGERRRRGAMETVDGGFRKLTQHIFTIRYLEAF